MTFKINHVRLRAMTSIGMFGADLPFKEGLNVLRAGNTKGKSTCMQAILYGFGLEKMLSPKREIPLPYAMLDHVNLRDDDDTGPPVVESWVSVEIENSSGNFLTIERGVKGGRDFRLVSTWDAPLLSRGLAAEEVAARSDYYVRDPGAAQAEAGFHRRLSEFIGWDLPKVPKFDGSMSLLYLETIFPLLFVEQKVGWSTIQGPFPTFLGIRDVARRVIEFLLNLDAQRVRVRKREIELKLAEVGHRWQLSRAALEKVIKNVNAAIQGIPADPTAKISDNFVPLILVFRGGAWLPLREHLSSIRDELARIIDTPIRKTGEVAGELEISLEETRGKIAENNALREAAFESLVNGRAELDAIKMRLVSLRADMRKNQDARKLQNYGSMLGTVVETGHCPTCHQSVDKELLPPSSGDAMALDENIAFIKAQIEMLTAMEKAGEGKIDSLSRELGALKEDGVALRGELRSIRSALSAPSSAPSELDVRQKIELDNEVQRLGSLEIEVSELIEDLRNIADEFIDLKSELAKLPPSDMSGDDEGKIRFFESMLRQQLAAYKFSTFAPSEVTISREHFRPYVVLRGEDEIEAETELTFQMSASDSIRLKWAYLLSLFEVGRQMETHHPGVLVFDEPRQQEAEKVSFAALIKYAVKAAGSDKQIIFATSEERDSIDGLIGGLDVNLLDIDGFLLKKLG
ncbi:MAG: hypothetical protein EPN20_03540 [Magnetospirillum sp.]|nr:MAG: hypothetical protein EPN20_03540 [Magnetospirillum sp.]